MKKLSLLLLLAGCEKLVGLHDTKLEPDASIDAFVQPDSPPDAPTPKIDVGDGHDGAVTITGVTTTDDRTALTADVGAHSTLLHVADASQFQIGDEVVIFQMTGSAAGQHETHRIASTQPSQLLLSTELASSYGGDGKVQVIRVPNFTNVMITTGTLTAHPWDGATGGIVFFRASGTVTVGANGAISADAIGFAGGMGGAAGTAGTGGGGGTAGAVLACPFGCSAGDAAPSGGNGQVNGGGMAGQNAIANASGCASGKGGDGAVMGTPGMQNFATTGEGVISVAVSTGGTNLSANASHPVLGAGGGGGIIIVATNAFTIAGRVSADGSNGTGGLDGTDAGNGGNGGDGGTAPASTDGTAGIPGTDGGSGYLFLSYVDACNSCNAFGTPTAVVTQL